MANRLAEETSPYLQQHAANPVDWYPWGPEALERARREDKPILLSVGYSACHWCHVMAHESFEDPEVAALMNRLFVNVKVDREERPDLDQIYQSAHQMLAQRPGGWPLTMFLAPDGTPFFGGTYFPKAARFGLPGFAELCERIAAIWRDQQTDIASQNSEMRKALARTLPRRAAQRPEFSPDVLRALLDQLRASFDPRFGGFGAAPKFPHPTDLELCLRKGETDIAHTTLKRMCEGGIYDQLGGGFSRYSVDAQWMIPHFEKMLYDNGPLLSLLADAWLVTGELLYARCRAGQGRDSRKGKAEAVRGAREARASGARREGAGVVERAGNPRHGARRTRARPRAVDRLGAARARLHPQSHVARRQAARHLQGRAGASCRLPRRLRVPHGGIDRAAAKRVLAPGPGICRAACPSPARAVRGRRRRRLFLHCARP